MDCASLPFEGGLRELPTRTFVNLDWGPKVAGSMSYCNVPVTSSWVSRARKLATLNERSKPYAAKSVASMLV